MNRRWIPNVVFLSVLSAAGTLLPIPSLPAAGVGGPLLEGRIGETTFRSSDAGRTWTRQREGSLARQEQDSRGVTLYARRQSIDHVANAQALSFGDLDDDGLQELYIEDYPHDAIDRYEFDTSLDFTLTRPLAYGLPWVLRDLDGDGNEELLVQRGDPGFWGNGYLDLYTWRDTVFVFLQRFTFPGMKTVYTPTTFDLDDDGRPEVIFTTQRTFSSESYVRVASWDTAGDSLALVYNYFLENAVGEIGAADFDRDGRGEFVVGIPYSSAIFEAEGDSIYLRGNVGTHLGFSTMALAWDALGNRDVRLLLGTTLGFVDDNWRFEIYRSTGDDTFELEEVLTRTTPYTGLIHGGTGDTDGDGKEEALLDFYPTAVLYEWTGAGYDSTWGFSQITETGTLVPLRYPNWDLDGDAYRDWVFVDHRDSLFVYGYDVIPPVTIALEPDSSTVPPGGTLDFTATVTNRTPEPRSFDTWSTVMLPDSSVVGPLLGPNPFTIDPGLEVTRSLSQGVPGNAPPGDYIYMVDLGDYPSPIRASDSIHVQVVR